MSEIKINTIDLCNLSKEELIERCQMLQHIAYKFHLLAQKTTELFLNEGLDEGFDVSFLAKEDLEGAA